jgi:DNA-binding response OmpR family regulator
VVKGMNFGADDYIRKPFGTEELKVRMNKALKRVPPAPHLIEAGALVIDLDKRVATVANQPVALGKREFDILAYLAKKAGDVISRDAILEKLDEKPEVYDRTIDSHMSHLRRKLREAGGDSVQIVAVYGVGYRLQFVTDSRSGGK